MAIMGNLGFRIYNCFDKFDINDLLEFGKIAKIKLVNTTVNSDSVFYEIEFYSDFRKKVHNYLERYGA